MVWLVDAGTFVRGLNRQRVTSSGEVTPHWGLDVSGPRHTPVRAVLDGRFLWRREIMGYGLTVALRHGENLSTFHAHLEEADDHHENAEISVGTMVGRMGNSTGVHRRGRLVLPSWEQRRRDRGGEMRVHLHWEVHPRGTPRLGPTVTRLDPVRWLADRGIDMIRPESI